MEPLSIVMATNKIDGYLDEAVTSVFANLGLELELVLVLDGVVFPPRKTAWMHDPRVTVVQREISTGLGAALNSGVKNARYEIVARLDADDIAAPDRFGKQLDRISRVDPPILIGSKIGLIDEHSKPLGAAKQVCGDDVRRDLLLHNVVPHSSYMFRKTDAIAVGLYREDLEQMEDYDFLLRMALKGRIAVLCESLVQYRVHSNQMSKNADWRANYITAVESGRKLLGDSLGVARVSVWLRNYVWRAYQVARSLRFVQPRHLVGVAGAVGRVRKH
jgi:glycosyltransferase involved in cell wall biosynthesis